MNVRGVLLRWFVAGSLGPLLMACVGMDGRDVTAGRQPSPPVTVVAQADVHPSDELIAERIRTRIENAGIVTDLLAAVNGSTKTWCFPNFMSGGFTTLRGATGAALPGSPTT